MYTILMTNAVSILLPCKQLIKIKNRMPTIQLMKGNQYEQIMHRKGIQICVDLKNIKQCSTNVH